MIESRPNDPESESTPHYEECPEDFGDDAFGGNSDPYQDSKVDRKLHIASPFMALPRNLRSILPLAALSLFSSSETIDQALLVLVIISLGLNISSGLIRYATLRYGVSGRRLVIRHGLISRTDRTIPFDRIKTIDLRRGLLHRWLRVADFVVETAGDDSSEASLSVLPLEEAQSLRQVILDSRRRSEDRVDESADVIWRCSGADLLVAGATENRTGAIMAGLYGLYEFSSDFANSVLDPVERKLDELLGAGMSTQVGIVFVILLFLALAGWGLSIAITVVTYFRFTLTERGDTLRRSYGLITRQESELAMPRIQALRIESNALRRMIGYTVIRANTAGSAAKQESSEATLLAPPLPVKDSRRILRKVHPHLDIDSVPIQRVHRYAIRRGFIRLALPGTLILGSVGFASSSFTPIYFFPLLWMLAFAWAILRYRGIGYALTDKEVIARSGVWTQTTWVVPLEKIQSVLLKQDPFQRRLGLATLSIETAGARSSSRAKIIDLDFVHSKALFRTIVREAAARDWTANPSDQEAAQNTVFE